MHAYVKSLWWSRLPYHTQSLIIPFLGKPSLLPSHLPQKRRVSQPSAPHVSWGFFVPRSILKQLSLMYGRTHCTRTRHQTPPQNRKLPEHCDARILAARLLPDQLHLGCWWLWGEVYLKGQCRTPHQCPQRRLQSQHGLGGHSIPHANNRLGLCQVQGTSVHVRVCQKVVCFGPQTSQQITNATTQSPTTAQARQNAKQTTHLQLHPKLTRRTFDKLLVSSYTVGSWLNPPICSQLPSCRPRQANSIHTIELIKWLLKYTATNLNAILTYKRKW